MFGKGNKLSEKIENTDKKIVKNQKEYRKNHPEKVVAQRKKYYNANYEKCSAQNKKYKKEHSEQIRAQRKKYASDHPLKEKARSLARYNVPLGSKCEDCGSTKNLGRHHEDYSKPSSVETLCHNCDLLRHKKQNKRLIS